MILSYLFGDEISKMDIAPDVITFGSYRVSVKHLASVSSPRNLRIWNALDENAVLINCLAFAACVAGSVYAKKHFGSHDAAIVVFVSSVVAYLALIVLVYWVFKVKARRNLVLLTDGGPITVFKNIRKRFAVEITRVLQNVMTGRETRRVHIDRWKRRISFVDAA